MTKIVPQQNARQGRWGARVLFILIAALVLVVIAWGGAEFYGESIDNSTPGADSTGGQGQLPKG
jgi:hypothetical protein